MSMIKYELYLSFLRASTRLHYPDWRKRFDKRAIRPRRDTLELTTMNWLDMWSFMVAEREDIAYHTMMFWCTLHLSGMSRHEKLAVEMTTLMVHWHCCFPSILRLLGCDLLSVLFEPRRILLLLL